MLQRKEYLDLRSQLQSGLLTEKGWKLFFEFWTIFREDNYQDPDFDTFAESFSQYLSIGNNYINAVDNILTYFDALYAVTTVSYAKNPKEILAIV